jgi:hypothetical protein
VLLDQFRSGIAARLLLIGIEGGDADTRAEASRQLADAMRRSGRFEAVHNGDNSGFEVSGRFLFEHRYLLSPAVDPARFTVDGLRAAIDDTVALLGTPAGALIKPILLRDPTGETVRMAEAMLPAHGPAQRRRRLGLARCAARGDSGDDACTRRRPRRPAAGLRRGPCRVCAACRDRAPRRAVGCRRVRGRLARADQGRGRAPGDRRQRAHRRAAAGRIRLAALARDRGAAGGDRVLAGIAAVSLGFGQVHGITLGFGTTLIGEAVDYAIYYLIQARAGRGRDAASTGPRQRTAVAMPAP